MWYICIKYYRAGINKTYSVWSNAQEKRSSQFLSVWRTKNTRKTKKYYDKQHGGASCSLSFWNRDIYGEKKGGKMDYRPYWIFSNSFCSFQCCSKCSLWLCILTSKNTYCLNFSSKGSKFMDLWYVSIWCVNTSYYHGQQCWTFGFWKNQKWPFFFSEKKMSHSCNHHNMNKFTWHCQSCHKLAAVNFLVTYLGEHQGWQSATHRKYILSHKIFIQ